MAIVDKTKALTLAGRVSAHVLRERVGPAIRPTSVRDVPPSAEMITPEWLTAVLCHGIPGARVVDAQVHGGSDGTSSRRRLAVTYNDAGRAAGLPSALFTKSTATLASRLLLGLTEIAEGEAIFYSRMRPGLPIRSPRSFHACFDPRTYRSMVLLEDLGKEGWSFPAPSAELGFPRGRRGYRHRDGDISCRVLGKPPLLD